MTDLGVWIGAVAFATGIYFSARFVAEAWERIARLAAEALVESEQIKADAYRYVADLNAGLLGPATEPEEPLPPEVEKVREWSVERYGEGDMTEDIVAMFEVLSGNEPGTHAQKTEYLTRLQRLGVPLDLKS